MQSSPQPTIVLPQGPSQLMSRRTLFYGRTLPFGGAAGIPAPVLRMSVDGRWISSPAVVTGGEITRPRLEYIRYKDDSSSNGKHYDSHWNAKGTVRASHSATGMMYKYTKDVNQLG